MPIMNKRFRLSIRALSGILWLAATLCSCTQRTPYVTVEGTTLGTTYRIKAATRLPASAIYAEAARLDSVLKHSMSIFEPESLLSRINAGTSDSLDSHLIYNILAADSVSRMSDGYYDITVKPLVEAWGFAGKQGVASPDLDSILPLVGYRKIRIDGHRLVKDDPRIQLDFNSIGKGYMVDLLARTLESKGCMDYLVSIAGSGRCRGVNENGGPWRIGVETPYDNNFTSTDLQRIVSLSGIGYATSGNYRRFHYTPDGRKIAHIIDPRTGRSAVSRLLSATVFCHNATQADALGTMFMSMGDSLAVAWARRHPEIMVYFIFATDKATGREEGSHDAGDYEVWYSPRLERYLSD